MGLYSSELDINKSDSEILSDVPVILPPEENESVKPRSRKKFWDKKKKGYPSSMPEDDDLEEEEERLKEELKDIIPKEEIVGGEEKKEEEEEVKEVEDLRLKEEDLEAIIPKKDFVDRPTSLGMSRAELRKMQEALTFQEGDIEHPNQMDLRVGKIIYILPHDVYDFMYVSEVDLGDYDESRLVGDGLRYIKVSMLNYREAYEIVMAALDQVFIKNTNLKDHYPDYKSLQDQYVVILCNVNPVDDREIKSKTGLLLLATKTKFDEEGKEVGEYAELVEPCNCEVPGARVYVDGFPKEDPVPKKNEEFFDFVMKDFTVDNNKQVVWRGQPLKIENCPEGKLVVNSLSDTYCKID